VNTESEVREELDRLFPGESNETRFDEWLDLVNQGLPVAAAIRIRKWKTEAERNRKISLEESVLNYTDLPVGPQPSGITISGRADILGSMIAGGNVITFEVTEYVDIDLKLATYRVLITLTKNNNKYISIIKYDEIERLLNAIQSMKRVTVAVTKFTSFQVDWVGPNNFSISVYPDLSGKIKGVIKINEAYFFLDIIQDFEKLEALIYKAKAYIESHLQCVGNVDFILTDEIERRAANLLAQLPNLVAERTIPHIKVLSTKYLQLTYLDEYGTRDYGSFYSEIYRFMSKIIPELNSDHREIARGIIFNLVEQFKITDANGANGFNENMNPLDYEIYCANAFSLAGWSTSMTPKTGDQGADVVVKHRDLTGVIQCKLYSQPVGNGAVQEVIAAREYYKASFAIVVSNAAYTTSARQLAAMSNVILLHHGEIAEHSSRLGVIHPTEDMGAPLA